VARQTWRFSLPEQQPKATNIFIADGSFLSNYTIRGIVFSQWISSLDPQRPAAVRDAHRLEPEDTIPRSPQDYSMNSEELAPGSPTCGPFLENAVFTRADGTVVNGTRGPFPNTIGTDAWYKNMGNANFNALQLTLKRTSGPLTLLATYTYGKSLDQSSSMQEQVYPYNYREEYAPSAFDIKHNFVCQLQL
jgi:hypothetical protein